MSDKTNLDIYAIGICYASMCANKEMTKDMIEDRVTELHPTGLMHGWCIADEPFADSLPNPKQCENNEERQHWLLNC